MALVYLHTCRPLAPVRAARWPDESRRHDRKPRTSRVPGESRLRVSGGGPFAGITLLNGVEYFDRHDRLVSPSGDVPFRARLEDPHPSPGGCVFERVVNSGDDKAG
ncbi:hypothetical protein KXW38_001135, partial [Aspergillus fumigatus]